MNRKTVWIAQNDTRKDFTAAEKYGELKDVFSSVSREYRGDKLIEHARRVLSKWQPGDSILVVGDPSLVAVCTAVVLEFDDEITLLRWDRTNFNYVPLTLNFSGQLSLSPEKE